MTLFGFGQIPVLNTKISFPVRSPLTLQSWMTHRISKQWETENFLLGTHDFLLPCVDFFLHFPRFSAELRTLSNARVEYILFLVKSEEYILLQIISPSSIHDYEERLKFYSAVLNELSSDFLR